MRVVGAGLGRTGTHSLKIALEKLIDAPCYHMIEVFGRPEHLALWREAATGSPPDWKQLLDGYEGIVDWPGASFWREMSEAFPDAIILLSTRADAEAWWRSARRTIFEVINSGAETNDEFHAMWMAIAHNRFTEHTDDREAAIAAYEQHNADVRATADPSRLVEWQPGDGWGPLCAALGVPIPDEDFPHVNTTDDFRAMVGLDTTPKS
ncbi:MAG: hypothetical protein QOC92_4452 [Acidimicrobiaceae bacterium]